MMQTDVKATSLTASGSVFGGPARVKGIVVTCGSTASSVVIKDGGASGTAKMTITTPAAAGIQNILIPGEGVKFNTDVHATLANATIVVFYG